MYIIMQSSTFALTTVHNVRIASGSTEHVNCEYMSEMVGPEHIEQNIIVLHMYITTCTYRGGKAKRITAV